MEITKPMAKKIDNRKILVFKAEITMMDNRIGFIMPDGKAKYGTIDED